MAIGQDQDPFAGWASPTKSYEGMTPTEVRLHRNRRLLESGYTGKDKERLEREIKRDTPRGFWDSLFTDEYGQETTLPFALPFIGSGASGVDLFNAHLASQKGRATKDQSRILRDYYDYAVRPTTTWGQAAGIGREVMAFGLEFAMSGGQGAIAAKAAAAGGKVATRSMLRKVLISGFREKSVQAGKTGLAKMGLALKEAALRTPGQLTRMELQKEGVRLAGKMVGFESEAGPIRARAYMNYLRHRYQIVPENEYGASVRLVDDSYGMWSAAIPNAVVDNLVEVFSEHTGYAIAHMVPSLKLGLLGKPLKEGGVGEKVMAALGLAGDVQAAQLLRKVGISGLVPEMGEEFVGALVRDIVHEIAPVLADEGNTQHLIDNIVPITLGMGLGIFGTSAGTGAISYTDGLGMYGKFSPAAKKAFAWMNDSVPVDERVGVRRGVERLARLNAEGLSAEGSAELVAGANTRAKFFGSQKVNEQAEANLRRKSIERGDESIDLSKEALNEEKEILWNEFLAMPLSGEVEFVDEEDGETYVYDGSPAMEHLISLGVIEEGEEAELLDDAKERLSKLQEAAKNNTLKEYWAALGAELIGIELARAAEAGVTEAADPEALRVAAFNKAQTELDRLRTMAGSKEGSEAFEEEIQRLGFQPQLEGESRDVAERLYKTNQEWAREHSDEVNESLERVKAQYRWEGEVRVLAEEDQPEVEDETVGMAKSFGFIVIAIESEKGGVVGAWDPKQKILFYNPSEIEAQAKAHGMKVSDLYRITIYRELLRAHITDIGGESASEWLKAAKEWLDLINPQWRIDLKFDTKQYEGLSEEKQLEHEVTYMLSRFVEVGRIKDIGKEGEEEATGFIAAIKRFAEWLMEVALPKTFGSSKILVKMRDSLEAAGFEVSDMTPAQVMMAGATAEHVRQIISMTKSSVEVAEKIAAKRLTSAVGPYAEGLTAPVYDLSTTAPVEEAPGEAERPAEAPYEVGEAEEAIARVEELMAERDLLVERLGKLADLSRDLTKDEAWWEWRGLGRMKEITAELRELTGTEVGSILSVPQMRRRMAKKAMDAAYLAMADAEEAFPGAPGHKAWVAAQAAHKREEAAMLRAQYERDGKSEESIEKDLDSKGLSEAKIQEEIDTLSRVDEATATEEAAPPRQEAAPGQEEPQITRKYLESLSRKAVIDLAKKLKADDGINVTNVSGSKVQIVDSILKALDEDDAKDIGFMALEETGRGKSGVRYYKGAFDDLKFSEFSALIAGNEKVLVAGRVKRQVVWFGPVGYMYAGAKHEAQEMPKLFEELARKIESETGAHAGYFNSVLANLFPKGATIPYHSDGEEIFISADETVGAVATVSLGGNARISIQPRAKAERTKPEIYEIQSGDMYLMPAGDFQSSKILPWEIDKKTGERVRRKDTRHLHQVGPASDMRISITFRHVPKNVIGALEETGPLQQRMTKEIGDQINERAKRHLPKERVKTRQATQFIGEGKVGSSTSQYMKMYQKEGVANTGEYTADDIVYVSSNGKRPGRVNPVANGELQGEYTNIDKAIKAGASIIMDTAKHLEETGEYNIGELALADYLATHGYVRQGVSGMWKPESKPEYASQPVFLNRTGLTSIAARDLPYGEIHAAETSREEEELRLAAGETREASSVPSKTIPEKQAKLQGFDKALNVPQYMLTQFSAAGVGKTVLVNDNQSLFRAEVVSIDKKTRVVEVRAEGDTATTTTTRHNLYSPSLSWRLIKVEGGFAWQSMGRIRGKRRTSKTINREEITDEAVYDSGRAVFEEMREDVDLDAGVFKSKYEKDPLIPDPGRVLGSLPPVIAGIATVDSMRMKGDKHYGNPFSYIKGKTLATQKVSSIPEAVRKYEEWLRGQDHQDVEPLRRDWIIESIRNGALDGVQLLYFTGGYRSHADALADYVAETRGEEARPTVVQKEKKDGDKGEGRKWQRSDDLDFSNDQASNRYQVTQVLGIILDMDPTLVGKIIKFSAGGYTIKEKEIRKILRDVKDTEGLPPLAKDIEVADATLSRGWLQLLNPMMDELSQVTSGMLTEAGLRSMIKTEERENEGSARLGSLKLLLYGMTEAKGLKAHFEGKGHDVHPMSTPVEEGGIDAGMEEKQKISLETRSPEEYGKQPSAGLVDPSALNQRQAESLAGHMFTIAVQAASQMTQKETNEFTNWLKKNTTEVGTDEFGAVDSVNAWWHGWVFATNGGGLTGEELSLVADLQGHLPSAAKEPLEIKDLFLDFQTPVRLSLVAELSSLAASTSSGPKGARMVTLASAHDADVGTMLESLIPGIDEASFPDLARIIVSGHMEKARNELIRILTGGERAGYKKRDMFLVPMPTDPKQISIPTKATTSAKDLDAKGKKILAAFDHEVAELSRYERAHIASGKSAVEASKDVTASRTSGVSGWVYRMNSNKDLAMLSGTLKHVSILASLESASVLLEIHAAELNRLTTRMAKDRSRGGKKAQVRGLEEIGDIFKLIPQALSGDRVKDNYAARAANINTAIELLESGNYEDLVEHLMREHSSNPEVYLAVYEKVGGLLEAPMIKRFADAHNKLVKRATMAGVSVVQTAVPGGKVQWILNPSVIEAKEVKEERPDKEEHGERRKILSMEASRGEIREYIEDGLALVRTEEGRVKKKSGKEPIKVSVRATTRLITPPTKVPEMQEVRASDGTTLTLSRANAAIKVFVVKSSEGYQYTVTPYGKKAEMSYGERAILHDFARSIPSYWHLDGLGLSESDRKVVSLAFEIEDQYIAGEIGFLSLDPVTRSLNSNWERKSNKPLPHMWDASKLPLISGSAELTTVFLMSYDRWRKDMAEWVLRLDGDLSANAKDIIDYVEQVEGLRKGNMRARVKQIRAALLVRMEMDYWAESGGGKASQLEKKKDWKEAKDAEALYAHFAGIKGSKLTSQHRAIFDLAMEFRSNPSKWAVVNGVFDRMNASQKAMSDMALKAKLIDRKVEFHMHLDWDHPKASQADIVESLGLRTDVGAAAAHKEFVSVLEGWSQGLKLRTTDGVMAIKKNGLAVAEATHNKALAYTLELSGIIKKIKKREDRPGHVALEDRIFRGYEAEKWVAKFLNNAMSKLRVIDIQNSFARNYMHTTIAMKHNLLMLGFFHHHAFPRSYFFTVDGKSAWRDFFKLGHIARASIGSYMYQAGFGTRKTLDDAADRFNGYSMGRDAILTKTPLLIELVRAGLKVQVGEDVRATSSGGGYDMDEVAVMDRRLEEAGKWLNKMGAPKVFANKVVGMLQGVRDFQRGTATWLFNDLGSNLKVAQAILHLEELLEKHKDRLKVDYDGSFREGLAGQVADLSNGDFGGMNELARGGRLDTLAGTGIAMPRHARTIMWARALFLAPDWTESNLMTVLRVLWKDGKMAEDDEILEVGRKMHQHMWIRVVSRGMFLQILINSIMAGLDDDRDFFDLYKEAGFPGYGDDLAPKWQKLRWLDINMSGLSPNDSRKFISVLGHFADPFHWASDMFGERGGLMTPLMKKGSPGAKTILSGMTGVDWAGRRFTTWDEFWGTDDDAGIYQRKTKQPDGTYKYPGQSKAGRYQWQISRYGVDKGPVGADQFFTYTFEQLRRFLPIQTRTIMDTAMGTKDGFDLMGDLLGFKASRTWPD